MITSAEMASSAVRYFERAAGDARDAVAVQARTKIGLAPDRVRALLEASRPLTPEEARRAMVRQVRPKSCGRTGLPRYAVELMYADYKRLRSLSKTGRLHARTRQSMYQIFQAHGLPLYERRFQRKIRFAGREFTPGKDGYYRATSGDRRQLHYVIWERANGPVPAGHQVTFKNADKRDFRIENLACMPIRDVTLFHHARHTAAKDRAKP